MTTLDNILDKNEIPSSLEEETIETGVIYCLTNKVTNKKYIGQAVSFRHDHGKIVRHGIQGRFKEHCNDATTNKDKCPKLYASMRKHGIDKFDEQLLHICLLVDLDNMESYYILKYNTINSGYNIVLGRSFNKNPQSRLSRIDKISETMKQRWNEPEYVEKTKEANFNAVMNRANSGKTRKYNKELNLPPNIYKIPGGYKVQIMRDGKYNPVKILGKNLSDKEKFELAIKKKEEILYKYENNIEIKQDKALDHNGNDLPKGIVREYGKEGYRVILRTHKNGKEQRKIRSFTTKSLTMDEKLKLAINALKEMKDRKKKIFNNQS